MCIWGTNAYIWVLDPYSKVFDTQDGYSLIAVDRCISDYVQQMNMRGIITLNSCCGHGERPGVVLIDPQSIPLLERYGYQYYWPKDDPDPTKKDDSWWRSRKDIVIHYLT